MYRKVLDDSGKVSNNHIFREKDNAWIPCNPDNRDYQEFLEWQKKEGNPKTIEALPTKDK